MNEQAHADRGSRLLRSLPTADGSSPVPATPQRSKSPTTARKIELVAKRLPDDPSASSPVVTPAAPNTASPTKS